MKVLSIVLLLCAAVLAEKQCPTDQVDDWSIELLLRHEDCEKFYKCTFGEPVEQSCFAGLYFNLDTWQCDWKQNVDCQDRNIPEEDRESGEVAPETGEPAPEEEEEVPEPEEEVAPEPEEEVVPEPEEEVVPEPEEEEVPEPEEELIPEEESPEVEEVPEETPEPEVAPEEEEEECEPEEVPEEKPEPEVEEEQEEECEEEEVAEEKPEPEEEEPEKEIEFQENGCPVDPHVHWLLPHEEDCDKFYYCVWGEKDLRECSATLHFNPELQVCDWPANAGCAVSANKHLAGRQLVFNRR